MSKKELTLKEHLRRIQRQGGKARWEGVSPEERSEQTRRAVEARWSKVKKAAPKKAAARKGESAKPSAPKSK